MHEHHFCLDDSPRFKMIELAETDSTNNFLLHYHAVNPAEITLVTADFQTSGRGQTGNHWESDAAKNLLFSLLVHPATLPASQMFVLSEAIALSIRDALEAHLQPLHDVTIKWPNDIYYKDRKMAGILIENALSGNRITRSVIGCGVNINQEVFHSDAPNPVSLFQLLGKEVNPRFVLEDIIEHFTALYADIQRGEYDKIHACYLTHLYRREGFHPYWDAQGAFEACVETVELDGHLLLRDTHDRLRRYAFKEVWIGQKGV